MLRHRRTFLLFLLACLSAAPALAQRVYWDPPGGSLGLGKTEPVSLVFEDCTPADGFRPPAVSGLDFGEPSESQQTTIVNFQMSTRVVLTFPARASQRGTVIIPAFDAVTNKGRIAVGEVRFDVGEAGVGPSGVAIDEIVAAQLTPSRSTLWAGELVEFEYLLSASSRYNVSIAGEPVWSPAGLVIEPFTQGERTETTIGGERRQAVRYRTRGIATTAGTLSTEPVRQLVNVQTGDRAVGFLSQPRYEQFTVDSNSPTFTVRALPLPAPEGFRGAVGSFTLESTIVPRTARIGEPITWTLTLSGSGNWTAGLSLPEREVSADFQVVQPKTRTEMDNGRLFQGRMIEDAVLVPTVAGTYSLGPVALTYFDTAAGEYRTQQVPAVTVQIDPVPTGYTAPAPQAAPESPGSTSSGLPGSSVAAPPPPLPGDLPDVPAIPGDPLPVGTSAAMPRRLPVAWLIAAPLTAPLLYWLGLAVYQAMAADAMRVRRRALGELRRLLRTASARATPPDRAALERWRTLTARVWAIRRATPTAQDLESALVASGGASQPAEWLTLWSEAEAAMFSAQGGLPADWSARALAAARAARIRGWFGWWPGRSAHWAPGAAAAVFLMVALTPPCDAGEARDSYREGRFAEAREAWSAHLAGQPGDWAAHHNVALAAAQLEAWPEASAHATAALLLNPRSESVRSHARLAVSRLDGVDPLVRRLVAPEWHDRAAFWLSPGEWQNLLIGGSIVVGLALATLITSLYLHEHRIAVRAAGQAMVLVGIVVVVASLIAASRYDHLAEPSAAMIVQATQLRSIPTDAAEKQQSVPIPAGVVVTIERSFLGWEKVRGRGESTGWVRRETVLPFYLPAIDAGPAR